MAVQVKRAAGPGAKQLEELIKGLGDRESKVGWFNSAKYEDGTPVAYVAAINEFGSPERSIPARSFMRTSIVKYRDLWAQIAKDGSKQILAGINTSTRVMQRIADQAKGNIQNTIYDIHDPVLSPITLGLRKVKMGRVPGLGPEVTGKTVGIVAAMLEDGTLDISGVPKKPLIEPTSIKGGGTLVGTIDAKVD